MAVVMTVLISVSAAAAQAGEPGARAKTAIKLNRGLADTPMRGTGWVLERVAWRWNISPYFIIGVSGKESSLGRYACRSNPRNIWGLKSCRTGSYIDLDGDGRHESLPVLRTWGHAYTWFARYIRVRQRHARTAFDIRNYCECDEHQWASVVAATIRRLFGASPHVRYR
jgi:hypothetical protein